jgi:hypothetical protein
MKGTAMPQVSLVRLYLLRATYLFMAVGLGAQIWPLILDHPADLELLRGVVRSLLGAVGLLALLGIRYPLKMLPLMFFEMMWKTIWVLGFGLPRLALGPLDPDVRETMVACLMGLIFPLVIPWGYVFRVFLKAPADPWTRRLSAESPRVAVP